MRLSQLLNKRIINIYDGEILGLVGDADLLVDEASGEIKALVVPWRGQIEGRGRRGERRWLNIGWDKVCKVGAEVIVVDVNPTENEVR